MVQTVPPAAILYNRDLGIVGFSSAFDTNVLTALTPVTNGTVVLSDIGHRCCQ